MGHWTPLSVNALLNFSVTSSGPIDAFFCFKTLWRGGSVGGMDVDNFAATTCEIDHTQTYDISGRVVTTETVSIERVWVRANGD